MGAAAHQLASATQQIGDQTPLDQASMGGALRVEALSPFTSLLASGQIRLENIPHPDQELSAQLAGAKVAIHGLGGLSIPMALAFSEAGAKVVVFTDDKPCAMENALGIIEDQGEDTRTYYHRSLPFFEHLKEHGAPIRFAPVTYLYREKEQYDASQGEYEAMRLVDGADPKSYTANEYPEKETYPWLEGGVVSFDSYIFDGRPYREYLVNLLEARGVTINTGVEIKEFAPREGFDITYSALGMGRKEIDLRTNPEEESDMVGRLGQIIHVRGELAELNGGSLGCPLPDGSVNILQGYEFVDGVKYPIIRVGATKEEGNDNWTPTKQGYEWLLNGAYQVLPNLRNLVEAQEGRNVIYVSEPHLSRISGCVRPTAKNGLQVQEIANTPTRLCLDASGAGGEGNSITFGLALENLERCIRWYQNQKA